jgi:tetratricopeptide (TPR) repeat protein
MPPSADSSLITLILGGDPAQGRAVAAELAAARTGAAALDAPEPASWPFRYPLAELPRGPVIVLAQGLEDAVVNHQTANTRLVTTQARYLMTEWQAALERHGQAWMVVTAAPDLLAPDAPEVAQRRGIFGRIRVLDRTRPPEHPGTRAPEHLSPPGTLPKAFRIQDPAERLRLCVQALDEERTPGALVATASACMEVNDLDAARRDLEDALALAPEWAAARFELGKLFLRLDDMEQAAAAFQAACDRLPAFGSAWANLGATLGELDRTGEALAAFERALADDPDSPQAVNNVGVVSRELGRLAESEAAFRRVTALAPEMAFGYYNLGHTLFLRGRYQAALSAYTMGRARDPESNAVQATRLAMCQLATGDAGGSLAELQRATSGLPRAYRRQLLSDTSTIAWALITHKPDLKGWKQVNDWLSAELANLGDREDV